MNHKAQQLIKYLTGDLISAIISWMLFYFWLSKQTIEQYADTGFSFTREPGFIKGIIFLPVFWIILHLTWGLYRNTLRRSRLKELGASLSTSLIGTLIISAILISSDIITGTSVSFFKISISLFLIHFPISYIPRLTITSQNISSIRKGRKGFNTVIIGSDEKAVDICKEIKTQVRSTGNKFIGFIDINGNGPSPMSGYLDHLGSINNLQEIVSKHKIEELILAIESSEHGKIENILNKVDHPGLVIKAIPVLYDAITGRVKINSIIETPLIQISHKSMPSWQSYLKMTLDIIITLLALILVLPVSVFIAVWIKLTSKGPVIYSHERIGKNGKPFNIYKFRTMIDNAEKYGPELSSPDDDRITGPGRFLRKTRLDEIPNFINVLKGDMSLVGPRPERRYYIDQILKIAPHYKHLLKIKPGITSWGQIKFGYAENVDQMVQRLKYDLIYLENMSVFVDLQILILTLLVVIKQDGV